MVVFNGVVLSGLLCFGYAQDHISMVKHVGTLSDKDDAPVAVAGVRHYSARKQMARSDDREERRPPEAEREGSALLNLVAFAALMIGAYFATQTEKSREIAASLGLMQSDPWTKMNLGKDAAMGNEENRWIAMALDTPLVQQALLAVGAVAGSHEAVNEVSQPMSEMCEVELDESWCPSSIESCRRNAEEKLRKALALDRDPDDDVNDIVMDFASDCDPLQPDPAAEDVGLGTTEARVIPDGASPLLSSALIDAMAEDAGDFWEGGHSSEIAFMGDEPLIFPTVQDPCMMSLSFAQEEVQCEAAAEVSQHKTAEEEAQRNLVEEIERKAEVTRRDC